MTRRRTVSDLLSSGEVILGGSAPSAPVVLSTRVRLARNIAGHHFPGWASPADKAALLEDICSAILPLEPLEGAALFRMGDLPDNDRTVLVESHLISRELAKSSEGSGALIDSATGLSIMINEEDHLRIQMVRGGLDLDLLYKGVDALDSAMETRLDYAFSKDFGYLTACPTNLGTGMRASVMLHLPGLVLDGHMEQAIRMMNQVGMTVRGHLGEGSEATGSLFQVSNQQTLGEDEATILRHLRNVVDAVIEQEINSRFRLLEEKGDKVLDKIGRARGVLQNGHLLSSEEAMDHLSLIRLAVDTGMLPEVWRPKVDSLFIASQPAHMQVRLGGETSPAGRDAARAKMMREEFAQLPTLTHIYGDGSAG